jgi:hypothetical protein
MIERVACVERMERRMNLVKEEPLGNSCASWGNQCASLAQDLDQSAKDYHCIEFAKY